MLTRQQRFRNMGCAPNRPAWLEGHYMEVDAYHPIPNSTATVPSVSMKLCSIRYTVPKLPAGMAGQPGYRTMPSERRRREA